MNENCETLSIPRKPKLGIFIVMHRLFTSKKDYIEDEKFNFIPYSEYNGGNIKDIYIMPPEFFTDKTKEYKILKKEIEKFINSK